MAAVGGFYLWSAAPEGLGGGDGSDYYNLLARGLLKGHLYLDTPADPFLATLANPADAKERAGHGLWDASYFRGRYYLYYGVTPALALFAPFHLLTGRFLKESLATPLFAWAGFLCSAWLLGAARRRHFPAAPAWVLTGCVLAAGLADMVPVLVRQPQFYEVPIACGYACVMLALCAIFQALHSRRPAPWLALAGAALGLAVGCRPTYILAVGALAFPLRRAWEQNGGAGSSRRRWRLAAAALVPLAAVGAGLAAYNYGRFGNPLEFGYHYQLGDGGMPGKRLFSPAFLAYNLRVYAFAPAGWTYYFPFVAEARLPSAPTGHLGLTDPFGLVPNMPFALVGLGALALLGRREAGPARAFCGALLAAAGATALVTSAFGGAASRYMVDFTPGFILLGGVGWLALAHGSGPPLPSRAVLTALAAGLAAYSAGFNVLASLRRADLLRTYHPAEYLRLAHCFGWISRARDRLGGATYGPVEMKLEFPADATGRAQPLLATGRDAFSDYVFVHYLGGGTVRFGFDHTGRGGAVGDPVRLGPGAHVLRVDLGSLYPPEGNPYFDRLEPKDAERRRETVRITCDGTIVLNLRVACYDAASPDPSIGSAGGRPGFTRPFSGRILSRRRLPAAELKPTPSRRGPVRLALRLPPFSAPHNEPLVSAGRPGRGDLVFVRYLAPGRICFGYDHWGAGGPTGPSLEVDPAGVQEITVDFGALESGADGDASAGRLLVLLNGRPALDQSVPYYPCEPDTVAAGLNAIGSSAADAAFTGSLLKPRP